MSVENFHCNNGFDKFLLIYVSFLFISLSLLSACQFKLFVAFWKMKLLFKILLFLTLILFFMCCTLQPSFGLLSISDMYFHSFTVKLFMFLGIRCVSFKKHIAKIKNKQT